MATPTTWQHDDPPQDDPTLGRRDGGSAQRRARREQADADLHGWVDQQVAGGLDRRTACRLAVLLLCVHGVRHDAGFLLGAVAHVEAALLDSDTFDAARKVCVGAELERVWRVLAGCTTGVSSDRCHELARSSRRHGLSAVAS